MISYKINILELPTNLGLKKTAYASEPGVRKLPDWLKLHGLHEGLKPDQVISLEPLAYTMDLDAASGVLNADAIVQYALDQSEVLMELMGDSNFQLILGGDCSILIGSALALRQKGRYGLFFLDGHTDFIGPELSTTGGAAGMDLAIATGHGHDKLTNISNLKPYLEEENVFCVGNRELDINYVCPVLDSKVHYYDLNRLREVGLVQTVDRFLDVVEVNNLDGYFVHLDVDVLNDDIMPAVDSRASDGLSYDELREILTPLLASKKAIGLELTILDPDLDPDGSITSEFVRRMVEIMPQ